jgi:hypothetical protein
MKSKGFNILNRKSNVLKSLHDLLDTDDKNCFICMNQFNPDECVISICKEKHYIHAHCGDRGLHGKEKVACFICNQLA